MGSIMKWNLFAPPKFGFIHVLPIFKTHRVELLSLSLWPGAPVWTCCRSWKNASVTSVPWSSFARGESLRHGSEASNHAVGQAETPFLFLGPLRTFRWELFENMLVSWKSKLSSLAMASWLWGKLDRYTKFIRSHKSKCVLCRFGTAWNRHSYLQKPCCLTHPWTYRVLPYHQRNIQICHQGIGAIKKKKHTNQVCLWQRKICSNQLPQLLVSRLCFAGSGLVLTISKNWRMLTSF